MAGLVTLVVLLRMNTLTSAPLPPVSKTDVTGTVAEARWVPKDSPKGRKGFSGSLGRDREIPAHFVATLRDYSGPSARQAWMMNSFVGIQARDNEDKETVPPTLVVWVNSADRDHLKAGMRIRLVNYTVTGDEGGTWTSCERLEFLSHQPASGADTRKPDAIPRSFRARIGGMLGLTCRVELADGTLVYATSRSRKEGDPVKVVPTPDQWREFRATLDELNVWRWEADYMNRQVRDGTQWSLVIEYSDHALKASGSNSYPDDSGKPNGKPETTQTFVRYLTAVEKLLGGRTFK